MLYLEDKAMPHTQTTSDIILRDSSGPQARAYICILHALERCSLHESGDLAGLEILNSQ